MTAIRSRAQREAGVRSSIMCQAIPDSLAPIVAAKSDSPANDSGSTNAPEPRVSATILHFHSVSAVVARRVPCCGKAFWTTERRTTDIMGV